MFNPNTIDAHELQVDIYNERMIDLKLSCIHLIPFAFIDDAIWSKRTHIMGERSYPDARSWLRRYTDDLKCSACEKMNSIMEDVEGDGKVDLLDECQQYA